MKIKDLLFGIALFITCVFSMFGYWLGYNHGVASVPIYNYVNQGIVTVEPLSYDTGYLTITSYNPEVGQTDSTPCIAGGTGFDLCVMAEQGLRPIAFSQDLIDWSTHNAPFSKGDRVIAVQDNRYKYDWRCNGEFIVADAMNARHKNKADIFFLDRKDNVACRSKFYKLNK